MNREKMDWAKALDKLQAYEREYRALGPTGLFGLMHVMELRGRYNGGERTRWLYDAIMAVE